MSTAFFYLGILLFFVFLLIKFYSNKGDNMNMSKIKFRYNQKVVVATGFYKGFKGQIKDIQSKMEKDKYTEREVITYIVEVDAKDKIITEKYSENDLRSSFF